MKIADNNKKVKRPGSGRTKGSFSFVNISLGDLRKHLNDADAVPIRVSRKWAEQAGFKELTSAPVKDLTGAIEGKTPETQAAVKVTDLDE
jgi:hypothetical protein